MSRFLCFLLSCAIFSAASGSFAQTPKRPTTTAKPLTSKQKLTPEQQRGLRLLKAAEAQAAGLAPAMQAAVLWQVAHGYSKIDRPRTISVLKASFRAATSADEEHPEVKCFITPDICHAKPWLERDTLSELVSLSPHDAEDVLPQAEDSIRSLITEQLIEKYVHENGFDHAQQLLRNIADQAGFPYEGASELMAALPPTRDQDRIGVFNLALGNFRTFGSADVNIEDLGTLVIRFWQHLPVPTVVEAIDALLKQAKSESEKSGDNNVSFSTEKGSISFSLYRYRLFELLPVLQQLDSSRAESLMREQQ